MPITPAPSVTDALGFPMGGGITVLDALVVAASDDLTGLGRQDSTNRNTSLSPAQFRLSPGLIHQLLAQGTVHR